MKVPKQRIAARYDYRDERGRVIYRLTRFVPKDFRLERPDGRPWTASRRRRLLYRLPDVIAADSSRPVFVVEGEKDVDRLWSVGLVATCNDGGGGVGKWTAAHSRPLRGRHVVVLPDNDKTGLDHAQHVARKLHRITETLRLVELPGLRMKGDVSDWLNAGNTAESLLDISGVTPRWKETPQFEPIQNQDYLLAAAYARKDVILSPLAPIEKLLLIVVLDLSDRRPPSQSQLASILGVSPRRVRQLVAKLREQGALSVSRYRGRNSYKVGYLSLPAGSILED